MKKRYESKARRRVVLVMLESCGVILYHTYSELNRLSVHQKAGMSDLELAFLKSQIVKLKDVADKLSRFRSIIYDDVKYW